MALKITMLFSVTTSVTDPTYASQHSGGWSESFWSPGNAFLNLTDLLNILPARANLLPAGAAIIGVRQGLYTIQGNKLNPQGTSGFKVRYPGSSSYTVNLPQDSLELSGQSSTSINSNRFRLGCMPDEVMLGGEFQPPGPYKAALTVYRNNIVLGAPVLGFVGRVLSNPSLRVLSITPGVGGLATVVMSGLLGAVVGTDYMRFHRVYNDIGQPVKGSFLTMAGPTPPTYLISGYTGGAVTRANGTARLDQIALYTYRSITVGRAVVKKIGRPFEQYRGRQSNRT